MAVDFFAVIPGEIRHRICGFERELPLPRLDLVPFELNLGRQAAAILQQRIPVLPVRFDELGTGG